MESPPISGSSKQVHGTNPQFLIEKVIRERIYDSHYWKEECFALTAASIIDKALQLKYIGGTFTSIQRPTPFICLLCKLLQIHPSREIIQEYLKYPHFKYLQILVAFYIRMTFKSYDVYDILEPMINDYRKIRYRDESGGFTLTFIDEFIDNLLVQQRVCGLILPRLTRRDVLEQVEGLAPRKSKLESISLSLQNDDDDDDSMQERIKRAKKKREEVLLEKSNIESTNDTVEYASQEEEDQITRSESESSGYISRSPSRSPDRI